MTLQMSFGIYSKASVILKLSRSIMTLSNECGDNEWFRLAKVCVPPLSHDKHKGQSGRIGVIGGSLEYTGGPYFAAISALKVGADLAHVFCLKAAAPVIKSYSPELIVHPLLDDENGVEEMKKWLPKIHVLIIGPGLGRDTATIQTVSEIITICREQKKPLIIDADGIFILTKNIDLIKDYPLPGIILTPNHAEFQKLYEVIKTSDAEHNSNDIKIDFNKLGKNILILKKGSTDMTFSFEPNNQWSCGSGGSARRCGGQGDLLAGSIATFFKWSLDNLSTFDNMVPAAVATFAAARLTRWCNERAFADKGRSMLCSDMIEKIHEVFDENFERK